MKNIHAFNVKYRTAAEYNSVNKEELSVEVINFPKWGDRYLTYTFGTAHTNSALTACIGVYGISRSVPFKHINGIEVT